MFDIGQLPEQLQRIRRMQRRRQADVAAAMHISREALSRIETHKIRLDIGRAEEWAASLGYRLLIDLEPLTTPEETPNP
jgi:transcriptional regulator with XRE-family HTH domain